MGSQVPTDELIDRALKENADAILLSKIVSQKDIHIADMRDLIQRLKKRGLENRFILVVGGPRVTHKLALELGFHAGFTIGARPSDVGNFLLEKMLEKMDRERKPEMKKAKKMRLPWVKSTVNKGQSRTQQHRTQSSQGRVTAELGQVDGHVASGRATSRIEGPVGVGKTFLVKQCLVAEKREYQRVDGDTRYTEQKLTGWFDPPLVLKKGYSPATFIDGPLVSAMPSWRSPFHQRELNRMPEAVQNILLPAMDEHRIVLPRLGEVHAKAGFSIIATTEPLEFTATHALSEAFSLDRFEMIRLDYQTREEELLILKQEAGAVRKEILERALDLVRADSSPFCDKARCQRACGDRGG